MNKESPAVKKTRLMKEKQINTELHHGAFPASKKINCAPKLCRECNPHNKKLLADDAIENFNLGVNTSNAIIDEENAKLKEENIALEIANALLKNELKQANDTLEELTHLCSKEILADVAYILKRRKEEDKLTNKKESE